MKKTQQPKLNVKIETVRPLTNDQLDDAQGGKSLGCDTALNCVGDTDNCLGALSDGCLIIKR